MSEVKSSQFFDYSRYSVSQLQFKRPMNSNLRIIGSEQYIFVPIRSKNREIFIQTPKIVVPFGLNIYGDSYYYVLSFTDSDIDPNIERFEKFLRQIEMDCQQVVKKSLNQWSSYEFNNLNFKSGFKTNDFGSMFRFKITISGRQVTEIYDETSQLIAIDDYDKTITNQCHVIALIEPANIWINPTEYGLTWHIHQLKVYPTTRPMGGISLLNETIVIHGVNIVEKSHPVEISIPIAPPLAPPITAFRPPYGGVSMLPFLSSIKGGIQLKKSEVNSDRPKLKSDLPEISLSEILNIRNRLKKREI